MIAFYVSLGAILGVCAVVLILQWRALGQRRIIGRRLDRYTTQQDDVCRRDPEHRMSWHCGRSHEFLKAAAERQRPAVDALKDERYTLTDKGYRSVMGGHEPDRWDE